MDYIVESMFVITPRERLKINRYYTLVLENDLRKVIREYKCIEALKSSRQEVFKGTKDGKDTSVNRGTQTERLEKLRTLQGLGVSHTQTGKKEMGWTSRRHRGYLKDNLTGRPKEKRSAEILSIGKRRNQ